MYQNSEHNDPEIGLQVEIGKENQEAEQESLPDQIIEITSPDIFLFQPNSFPDLNERNGKVQDDSDHSQEPG